MAYIESFFYYILVTLVAFVGVSLFVIFLYFVAKIIYKTITGIKFAFDYVIYKDEDIVRAKPFLPLIAILKHKFFKFGIFLYFSISVFFYISHSINYYGEDRAYPKAKSYAIVADTVMFWESVLINIKMRWGFMGYVRLVQPEDFVDRQIQKVQTSLLNKMYQYIPKDDGERDVWHYKYKQLYIAKLRYLPVSDDDPNPRIAMITTYAVFKPHLLEIMDDMHKVSQNLYSKPINDKVFNKEKYLFIAQMSYYLEQHIAFYATLEKMHYMPRLKLMERDTQLFQKYIDYVSFLEKVLLKVQNNQEIAEVFNQNPYSLGLLYVSLLQGYDSVVAYHTHNGLYPCDGDEIKKHSYYLNSFYDWINRKNSSFKYLSKREQKQIRSLWDNCLGHGTNYIVAKYICDTSFKFFTREEYYIERARQARENGVIDKKYPGIPMSQEEIIISFDNQNRARLKELLEIKKRKQER